MMQFVLLRPDGLHPPDHRRSVPVTAGLLIAVEIDAGIEFKSDMKRVIPDPRQQLIFRPAARRNEIIPAPQQWTEKCLIFRSNVTLRPAVILQHQYQNVVGKDAELMEAYSLLAQKMQDHGVGPVVIPQIGFVVDIGNVHSFP